MNIQSNKIEAILPRQSLVDKLIEFVGNFDKSVQSPFKLFQSFRKQFLPIAKYFWCNILSQFFFAGFSSILAASRQWLWTRNLSSSICGRGCAWRPFHLGLCRFFSTWRLRISRSNNPLSRLVSFYIQSSTMFQCSQTCTRLASRVSRWTSGGCW